MSTEHPMLVVVIPTKNRRELLARALESVRIQDYDTYRVVVIDDGSTDETSSFLQSLDDPHLCVIRHEKSRGVNAARNAAYRTLTKGEWAIPLDDDDRLLPGALQIIAQTIQDAPQDLQILSFNTITAGAEGQKETGRRFKEGELWHDPTYYEFFVDPETEGDLRSVYRHDLFPTYLFSEDVNGFEGEWALRIARDGIRMRIFPARIIWIDATHAGEHLSQVAARRDPASFARAHARIFKTNAVFFKEHPEIASERAVSAFKLALRAYDPIGVIRFSAYYLQARIQMLFRR